MFDHSFIAPRHAVFAATRLSSEGAAARSRVAVRRVVAAFWNVQACQAAQSAAAPRRACLLNATADAGAGPQSTGASGIAASVRPPLLLFPVGEPGAFGRRSPARGSSVLRQAPTVM